MNLFKFFSRIFLLHLFSSAMLFGQELVNPTNYALYSHLGTAHPSMGTADLISDLNMSKTM